VLRTGPSRDGRKRCFTKDEGGPLGIGLQEQVSNRHKLRESRVLVVSVDGKGGEKLRQVRFKKTNVSEPLMTCRNVLYDVETGTRTSVPRSGWGQPVYCPTGVRHESGVILNQALVRNVGTCRPNVKGEIQVDCIREDESTDVGHRGGVARSRVEGSVMELDRRGDIVRLGRVGNPQGEDSHG
jgi:hypothetical protein